MIYKKQELIEFNGTTSSKFIELSNTNISKLYVICRAPNDKGSTKFWCECTCGDIRTYHSTHLKRGLTKMCRICAKDLFVNKHFKGVGDISLTYWSDLKHGAAGEKASRNSRKTRKFEITIEEAWQLYLIQNRKCALSGIDINFCKIGLSRPGYRKKYQTASLDRIDSTKDYTLDNIQWIHKDINRMKNIYEQNYFINMCKLIGDYNDKKI